MNEMTVEQKVWMEAWVHTAQASNCVKLTSPTLYADECLAQFRGKFGNEMLENRRKLSAAETALIEAKEELRQLQNTHREGMRLYQECAADYNKKAKELVECEDSKNNAYGERNKLVAALSKIFPAWLGLHNNGEEDPSWDPEWLRTVLIQLPTGQVTWHIKESDLSMFPHLKQDLTKPWDGHDTPEKYRRLAALCKMWKPVCENDEGAN